MDALVASIKKHKNFKRLAVYSIEALVKTAAPPASGWLENARTAHSLGALSALQDVLERYPDDIDLFHTGIRQINAMVVATGGDDVFKLLADEHSKVVKAITTFFEEHIGGIDPASVPHEEWQARRDILEQLASIFSQCAYNNAGDARCNNLLRLTLKILPSIQPSDSPDATHFNGLSSASFHSPVAVRLVFQGLEVITRSKSGLQQCCAKDTVMHLVHSCQLYTDGAKEDNAHVRYAFRFLDRLSRDAMGLQSLRDIRAVAALAPSVEFSQRWKSVGSYAVKILARVLGDDLSSLLLNITGMDDKGSSITEREAEFAASLASSLALEQSIRSRFVDELELRKRIITLPRDAVNEKARLGVLQMMRRILRLSRNGAQKYKQDGLLKKVLVMVGDHASHDDPLILAEAVGCLADLLQRVVKSTAELQEAKCDMNQNVHTVIFDSILEKFQDSAPVCAAVVEFSRTFVMRSCRDSLPAVSTIAKVLGICGKHHKQRLLIYYESELILEYIKALKEVSSDRTKEACKEFTECGCIEHLVGLLRNSSAPKLPQEDDKRRSLALSLGNRFDATSMAESINGDRRSTLVRPSSGRFDDIGLDEEEGKNSSIDLTEEVDEVSIATSPMYAIALLCEHDEQSQQLAKSCGCLHGIINAYTNFVEHAENQNLAQPVFGAFLCAVNALIRKDDIAIAVRGLFASCEALQNVAGRADLYDMAVKELQNGGLDIGEENKNVKLPEHVSLDNAEEISNQAIEYACLLEVISASPPHAFILTEFSGVAVLVRFVAMLAHIKGVAARSQKQTKSKLAWDPMANKSTADAKKLSEPLQEELMKRCCQTLEKLAHLGHSQSDTGSYLENSEEGTVFSPDIKGLQARLFMFNRLTDDILQDLLFYGNHSAWADLDITQKRNLGDLKKLPELLKCIARGICYAVIPKVLTRGINSLLHLLTAAVSGCVFLGTLSALKYPQSLLGVAIEAGTVETCTAVIRRASSKYFWAVGSIARGLSKIARTSELGAEAVVTRGATRQLIREISQESKEESAKSNEQRRSWDTVEDLASLSGIVSVIDAVADSEKSANILKKQGVVSALIATLEDVSEELNAETANGADLGAVLGKEGVLQMESSRNLISNANVPPIETQSSTQQGDAKEISILRSRARVEIIEVLTKLMDSSSVPEALRVVVQTEKAIKVKSCSASQAQACHLALTTLSALCRTQKGKDAGSKVWCDVIDACSQLALTTTKLGKSSKALASLPEFQKFGLMVAAKTAEWISPNLHDAKPRAETCALGVDATLWKPVVQELLAKVNKLLQSSDKFLWITAEGRLEALHCLSVVACDWEIGEHVLRDTKSLQTITTEVKKNMEVWNSNAAFYSGLVLRNFSSLASMLKEKRLLNTLVDHEWLSLAQQLSNDCLENVESTSNMQIRAQIGKALAYSLETVSLLSGKQCGGSVNAILKEAMGNIEMFAELDDEDLLPSLVTSLSSVCTLCHVRDPRNNSKLAEKLLDSLCNAYSFDSSNILASEKASVSVFAMIDTLCARKGNKEQINITKENRAALQRLGVKDLIVGAISSRYATDAMVSAGSKALTALEGDVQGQYGFASLVRDKSFDVLRCAMADGKLNGEVISTVKSKHDAFESLRNSIKRFSAALVSSDSMYKSTWLYCLHTIMESCSTAIYFLYANDRGEAEDSLGDQNVILGILAGGTQAISRLLMAKVEEDPAIEEVVESAQFNSFVGIDIGVIAELSSKKENVQHICGDKMYRSYVMTADIEFEKRVETTDISVEPLLEFLNRSIQKVGKFLSSKNCSENILLVVEACSSVIYSLFSNFAGVFHLRSPELCINIIEKGVIYDFFALGVVCANNTEEGKSAQHSKVAHDLISYVVKKAVEAFDVDAVREKVDYLLPLCILDNCGYGILVGDTDSSEGLDLLWSALSDSDTLIFRVMNTLSFGNDMGKEKIEKYYGEKNQVGIPPDLTKSCFLLHQVMSDNPYAFGKLEQLMRLLRAFYHAIELSKGPELTYDDVQAELSPAMGSQFRQWLLKYAEISLSSRMQNSPCAYMMHLLAYNGSHAKFAGSPVIDSRDMATAFRKALYKEHVNLFPKQKDLYEFASASTAVWLIEILRRSCLLEDMKLKQTPELFKSRVENLANLGIFQTLCLSTQSKVKDLEYIREVFRLLSDVSERARDVLGGTLMDGMSLLKIDHRSYATLQSSFNHYTDEQDDFKIREYGVALLAALEEIFEDYSAWGFLKALKSFLANSETFLQSESDESSKTSMYNAADGVIEMCQRVDTDVIPSVPRDVLDRYCAVFTNQALNEHKRVATANSITAARLVDNAHNVNQLATYKIIDTAFKLVKRHTDSPQICDYIITFLRPFSLKQEHVSALKKIDHVKCLADLAKKYCKTETSVAWINSRSDRRGENKNSSRNDKSQTLDENSGEESSEQTHEPNDDTCNSQEDGYYPRISHHCVQLFANIACDTPELDENGVAVEKEEKSGVENLLEVKAVPAIRSIMETQMNQPRILEDSLCALSNMAYTTDEARSLIGKECGNVIVQSLQVFHEDPFLFSMALRAIGNLTRVDANIITIMQHSIGKPICAGMMANINNPDVLQIACDVLGNLVSVDEEGLDRDFAIDTLRIGVKNIKVNSAKQQESVKKLGFKILPTPVIDMVLQPSFDPKDFDFQAVVAEWLLVDGAAESCLRVLKQHYTNPEVVGSALRALQYFGEVEEILRTLCMELDYPANLALVLRSCDFDSTVCERGAYAWAQHLRLDQEVREKAFEANAHYILLSMLETHKDEPTVSDITLRVVAMATIDENSSQTLTAAKEMNSHRAVLRILQNTTTDDLKLHAVVLLSKWAEDRSVVKRMAVDTLKCCKDMIFCDSMELQLQCLYLVQSLLQYRKIVDVSVHLGVIENIAKYAIPGVFEMPEEVLEVVAQILVELSNGKPESAADCLKKGAECLCDALGMVAALKNDIVTYKQIGRAYLKLLGQKSKCQAAMQAEDEQMKLTQATAVAKAAAAAQEELEADSGSETSSDEESFEMTNSVLQGSASADDEGYAQGGVRPGILPLERFPMKVLKLLLKGVSVAIWFLPYMHKKGKLKQRTMLLLLSQNYDTVTFQYTSNKLNRELQWQIFLCEVVNVRIGLPLHKLKKRLFAKSPNPHKSVCLDTVEGTRLHVELPSPEDADAFKVCMTLLSKFAKARSRFRAIR